MIDEFRPVLKRLTLFITAHFPEFQESQDQADDDTAVCQRNLGLLRELKIAIACQE